MTGSERRRVALILTVKDEADSIDALLAAIAAQHRPPDEIIVVDGGSCDSTPARLAAWQDRLPLSVLTAPGANIAAGRNLALRRARGEIVAVTDAGVRLAPDWLAELAAPFERPLAEQPDVVAGFFRAAPANRFERVLGAVTLPDEVEIDPGRFLPSSRSLALRRSLIEAGVRYPEWLDYCEDLVFDLRLRAAGARFAFRPQAVVWFRPRPTLGAYWRQYFRYARGDGKAGLFARRHALRYATYLGLLPLVLAARDRRVTAAGLVAGAVYMRRPWLRLWRRQLPLFELLPALALAPALRLAGDLAKMVGYPVGLAWRARRYGLRRGWREIPELPGGCADLLVQGTPEELSRP
ncbi:MAG TPA: glycosyltransferase [Thermomicrobiaceae bacterium]|nr:glycosyltransferase [Thermomicrobiaceae bacterium]